MQFLTATETRKNILQLLKELHLVEERFIITRDGKPAAVLMSYREYENLLATLDVMADPELQRKIKRGLQDEQAGRLRSMEDVFGENL
jgi:prevent-host-death family protein